MGISDKGNGYTFLIDKSNRFVEIDSKDAKFNESFSDYRGRQGKIMAAPFINPDLKEESEDNHKKSERMETTSNAKNDEDHNDKGVDQNDEHQQDRLKRHTTPRQFPT